MAKTYRIGVIGRTGRGDYGHGLDTVWSAVDGTEVVAVADENESGAKAAAERTGAKAVYTDYRKMLREDRPDIVAVCPRWVDPHLEMALACAESGASMYMEKPMARSPEEADAIADACDRAHVKLQLAHQMKLSPAVLHARDQVSAGAIGQLLEVRGRGKEDRRAGGEDLMVLGSHVMDLMRIFAGDPRSVFARVTAAGEPLARTHVRDGNEGLGPLAGDVIQGLYEFAGGVGGTFASKRCRQTTRSGARFGVDVCGSEGVIAIRAGFDPDIHILRSPAWSPAGDGANWERLEPPGTHERNVPAANARMVRDLIAAIEEDREPAMSAREGRWTIEMALALYASQITGGPVALPLEDRKHPLARLGG